MLLPCPSCSTHYDLPNRLPEAGAKVRCTNCAHVWHASNDELLAPEEEMNEEEGSASEEQEPEAHEPPIDAPVDEDDRLMAGDAEPAGAGEGIPPVSPFDEEPFEALDFNEIDESADEPVAEDALGAGDEASGTEDGVGDVTDDTLTAAKESPEDSTGDLTGKSRGESADEAADAAGATDEGEADDENEGAADNDQDDIDALFASGEAEDETDNSQDDIDNLFDEDVSETAAEDDSNSQGDIDSLFDTVDEGEAIEGPDEAEGVMDVAEASLSSEPGGGAGSADLSDQGDVVADDELDPFDQLDNASTTGVGPETLAPLAAKTNAPIWKRLDQKVMVGWACYGLTVLFIGLFLVSARVSVVRALPGMAGLYETMGMPVNVLGVMFTNVQQRWDTGERLLKLKVDGEVTNLTSKYKPVPDLVVVALSEDKREVFRWVVKVRKKPLLPGEKAPFVAEVPAPPERAKLLLLHFDAE